MHIHASLSWSLPAPLAAAYHHRTASVLTGLPVTPYHPVPMPLTRSNTRPPRSHGCPPSGDPIPHIEYTPQEVEVWGAALRELKKLFPSAACREFLHTYPLFNFR